MIELRWLAVPGSQVGVGGAIFGLRPGLAANTYYVLQYRVVTPIIAQPTDSPIGIEATSAWTTIEEGAGD